jgi:hypothetical protein
MPMVPFPSLMKPDSRSSLIGYTFPRWGQID